MSTLPKTSYICCFNPSINTKGNKHLWTIAILWCIVVSANSYLTNWAETCDEDSVSLSLCQRKILLARKWCYASQLLINERKATCDVQPRKCHRKGNVAPKNNPKQMTRKSLFTTLTFTGKSSLAHMNTHRSGAPRNRCDGSFLVTGEDGETEWVNRCDLRLFWCLAHRGGLRVGGR